MSADDARLLSIAVEALVAATIAGILNRRRRPAAWSGWRSPGLRIAAAALAALAGTLLSHPAAWPAMPTICSVEMFAATIEMPIKGQVSPRPARKKSEEFSDWPAARRLFWQLIYDLAARGTTVLVTTHYMDEAARCHRLAFMSKGRLFAVGTADEITRHFGQPTIEDVFVALQRQDEGVPA